MTDEPVGRGIAEKLNLHQGTMTQDGKKLSERMRERPTREEDHTRVLYMRDILEVAVLENRLEEAESTGNQAYSSAKMYSDAMHTAFAERDEARREVERLSELLKRAEDK